MNNINLTTVTSESNTSKKQNTQKYPITPGSFLKDEDLFFLTKLHELTKNNTNGKIIIDAITPLIHSIKQPNSSTINTSYINLYKDLHLSLDDKNINTNVKTEFHRLVRQYSLNYDLYLSRLAFLYELDCTFKAIYKNADIITSYTNYLTIGFLEDPTNLTLYVNYWGNQNEPESNLSNAENSSKDLSSITAIN